MPLASSGHRGRGSQRAGRDQECAGCPQAWPLLYLRLYPTPPAAQEKRFRWGRVNTRAGSRSDEVTVSAYLLLLDRGFRCALGFQRSAWPALIMSGYFSCLSPVSPIALRTSSLVTLGVFSVGKRLFLGLSLTLFPCFAS